MKQAEVVESIERSAIEDLAAHNAMRIEFDRWLKEPSTTLFDLVSALNTAAARASKAIRDARR